MASLNSYVTTIVASVVDYDNTANGVDNIKLVACRPRKVAIMLVGTNTLGARGNKIFLCGLERRE